MQPNKNLVLVSESPFAMPCKQPRPCVFPRPKPQVSHTHESGQRRKTREPGIEVDCAGDVNVPPGSVLGRGGGVSGGEKLNTNF